MKNIIKLVYVFAISLCFVACSNDDGLGFQPIPESGWVQFFDNNTSATASFTEGEAASLEIPVELTSLTNPTDLTVTYSISDVAGTASSIGVSGGSITFAGGQQVGSTVTSLSQSIVFNMTPPSTFPSSYTFDVVLESTSRGNVSVGLSDGSKPTTYRVNVQFCPDLNASTGRFIGDYELVVTSGPGPFGAQFADGQTVTLAEGADGGLSRTFSAIYLPAFSATAETMNFAFVDGEIIISDTASDTGCSSAIILGGDPDNIGATPCGDDTIVLNMLDFLGGSGGCGVGDVPMEITLTKL